MKIELREGNTGTGLWQSIIGLLSSKPFGGENVMAQYFSAENYPRLCCKAHEINSRHENDKDGKEDVSCGGKKEMHMADHKSTERSKLQPGRIEEAKCWMHLLLRKRKNKHN